MKFLFRPSLARRLVLALCAAFGLVGVVLIAWDYAEFQGKAQEGSARVLEDFSRHLATRLEGARTPEEARAAVTILVGVHTDVLAKEGRQEYALAVWLWDRSGRPLLTPPHPALPADLRPGRLERRSVQGRVHYFSCTGGPSWRLCAAQQELRYLSFFRLWDNFLVPMLLAFPFVLAPLLWAVHRGLGPLRALARQVETRRAEDFSPLAVAAPQAELRPIVAAIDHLLERTREHVEREKAFVHDAAHELQTPLAGILAQAHVLARAEDAAARRVALGHLEQGVARASHLIRQMLQLDRLGSDDAGAWETRDIARLVRDALARQGAKAQARRIDLGLEAPDHLEGATRPQALLSILDNLVDNALAYVPEGGRVEVSLTAEAGGYQLQVADDGPGIPAEDRERVFRRFHRGRGHDQEGSGLGLAIARQAARALGGSLTLTPGLEGRGCGFLARLPWPAAQR